MEKIINWVNKPFVAYPDITERLVYLLIFLFPIAGMSVRHWITNIFNLLVIIALFTLRKPREPLLTQEKYFLWICAAYFSMFIISSLANGWEKTQTYYLGTELRFLLVIPLYLLLRRYPDCSKWFLHGAVIGGFFLIGQAYYDLYIIGNQFVLGVYSKNLTGPFAVLIGFWGGYLIWLNHKLIKWQTITFILLSVLAAWTTAVVSGSRGGYVGFIITAVICIGFFTKPKWIIPSLASICLVIFLGYQNSSMMKRSVGLAFTQVQEYFQAKDHINDLSSDTSTGVRLEMIRTSIFVIRENPFAGFGPGNYNSSMQKYINEGKASPFLNQYNHPHNAFLEAITAKGVFGLITLLLLFYYPAYIFFKNYKICRSTAILGIIHIAAISAFSLTDHSVILMNNYTSIFLLGLTIFLSSHIRCCKHHLEPVK